MLKQFLIEDILKKVPVKKISLKKNECSNHLTKEFDLPARTATTQNQGLSCYVPRYLATVLKDKISVSANGDFCAFWHDADFTILQDSYALEGKNIKLNKNIALYIISSMYSTLAKKYNWNNKSGWEKIKKEYIYLPTHNILYPDFAKLQDVVNFAGGGDVDMSKIDTSSWKEFKLSEVFGNAKLGKYHNPENLQYDKDGYLFICASNQNNGINSAMPRVLGQNLVLTPSKIVAWGKQCPMFTYHNEPCVTSQGMYYYDMTGYSEEVCLFLCGVLENICKGKYNYSNCLIGSVADDLIIKLPVKETEEIDWNYMEERIAELEQERIAELEQERIAELEQYLIATGLNDYELTEENKNILSFIPQMREFSCNDLFDKADLKWKAKRKFNKSTDLSQEMTTEFNLPLVNAKNGNNGIMYYGRKIDWEYISGGIDIVNDGAVSTGNVYPQPHNIGVLYNAYLVTIKGDIKNQQIYEYIACVLEKAIKNKYDYSNKAGWEKVKHEIVCLPIQTDENNNPIIDPECKYHPDGYIPDWYYMKKYIEAIEKIVIKDVVKYKDEAIAKTKEIIEKD